MRKNVVALICILFFTNVVPIIAETPEIRDARLAGKNDAKSFQWQWFAAGYMTANVSVIVVVLVESLNRNYLDGSLGAIPPACWYTIYGAYVLTPTAVALVKSPTPPPERLLGKSSEWVNAYTKAYQKTMRRSRAKSSLGGCFSGGTVLAATVLALIPAIVGNTPGSVD